VRLEWLLLVAGCGGSNTLLEFDPPSVDWGVVDFQQDLPEGGYGQVDVSVWNRGERAVDLQVGSFDLDRLCVNGWTGEGPYPLGPLNPGSFYLLAMGVCGYVMGERDTLVAGQIDVEDDDGVVLASLPWSFTPIRDLDTGE